MSALFVEKAEEKQHLLTAFLDDLQSGPQLHHDIFLTLVKIKAEVAPDGQSLAYLFSNSKNPLHHLARTIKFFVQCGGYDEEYALQFLNRVPLLVQQGTESTLRRILNFLIHTPGKLTPQHQIRQLEQSTHWGEQLAGHLDAIFAEFPGPLQLKQASESLTPLAHFIISHLQAYLSSSRHESEILSFIRQLLQSIERRMEQPLGIFVNHEIKDPSEAKRAVTQMLRKSMAHLDLGPVLKPWPRYVVKGLFYDKSKKSGVVRNVSLSFRSGTGKVHGPQLTAETLEALNEARKAALICLDREFGVAMVKDCALEDVTVEISQDTDPVLCEGGSLGLALAVAFMSHAASRSLHGFQTKHLAVTGQVVLDEDKTARVVEVNPDTLQAKVQAALADQGIEHVIIPFDNRDDCTAFKGLVAVRNLNELFEILFPFEPLPPIPLGISAEQAVNHARQLVIRNHHHYFGTPHLFLGLSEIPHGCTQEVLKQADVDVHDLCKTILGSLSPGNPARRVPLTKHCYENLSQAVQEAYQHQSPYVEEQHLFIAILKNRKGSVPAALEKKGINSEKLLEMVEQQTSQGLN